MTDLWSAKTRIGPLHFYFRMSLEATKHGFSFLGVNFMLVVYFVTDACLLLLCLFQFFSTKPRDWLGRTSPKWANLCRVRRRTTKSTTRSIKFLRLAIVVMPCSLSFQKFLFWISCSTPCSSLFRSAFDRVGVRIVRFSFCRRHWTDEMLQTRGVLAERHAGAARNGVARVQSICGSSCWRCCRVATTAHATSSGLTESEASSNCSTPKPCRVCGASRRTSRAWTTRRWDARSGWSPPAEIPGSNE